MLLDLSILTMCNFMKTYITKPKTIKKRYNFVSIKNTNVLSLEDIIAISEYIEIGQRVVFIIKKFVQFMFQVFIFQITRF